MLGRTLKRAFWVSYDHLGKLIVANLMWAMAILFPGLLALTAFRTGDPGIELVVGVPALVLTLGVLLPVMSAGLAHMAAQLIDTRDGSVMDLFTGIRLYWRRAIGVGFFFVLAVTCLSVSAWFYAVKLRDAAPWLGYAISALALWCLAFISLMAMLVMPALVQRKANLLETLKLTALLVLDNPLFCFGLAIQFLGVIGLSLIPPVFLFLSGFMVMVLAASAYEQLARKYAALEAGQGGTLRPKGDPGADGHLQGVRGKNALLVDDAEDDYLNRGFRDFLFPWKG